MMKLSPSINYGVWVLIVDIVKKILHSNKQPKGKELPSDLARVATVSDRKHIKILTAK